MTGNSADHAAQGCAGRGDVEGSRGFGSMYAARRLRSALRFPGMAMASETHGVGNDARGDEVRQFVNQVIGVEAGLHKRQVFAGLLGSQLYMQAAGEILHLFERRADDGHGVSCFRWQAAGAVKRLFERLAAAGPGNKLAPARERHLVEQDSRFVEQDCATTAVLPLSLEHMGKLPSKRSISSSVRNVPDARIAMGAWAVKAHRQAQTDHASLGW